MRILLREPGLRERVEEWLRDPGRGRVIKDNRTRTVYCWDGLFIKRYKNSTFWQRVRRRIGDRAAREYGLLERLRGRGLPVPEPVAWAEREGETFLFTREIPGARPLGEEALGRPVLRELAAFVRRLHDAGMRHDDLHLGNILRAGDGGLHVVDVHEARLGGALSPRRRRDGLAFVVLALWRRVSQTDVVRFLRAYGADPREVLAAFRRIRERYWRSRQSRVERTGSDFEVRGDLVLRRPFTEEAARRALGAAPLRWVKELPHRRLWLADPETFVKEGAGRRLWYNGFGLEIRGIPTPRLLARCGDRVVGRWIAGARPLGEHLKAEGVSRDLVWRLARLVRRMHDRGVWHRDLKANNILVRGGELWVVDLDRVEFRQEVPPAGRVENLAQLNAAVGPPVTRADRLRFFFAYAARDREMRRAWKAWVRRIMRATRARRHVWP